MVERNVANVEVASSRLVSRFDITFYEPTIVGGLFAAWEPFSLPSVYRVRRCIGLVSPRLRDSWS